MSHEAVARRYARAVFELAKDAGKVTEITRELLAFAEAYESSTDLRAIETLPGLTEDDRSQVIRAIGERLGASDTTVRAVTMMTQRQRLATLPEMARLVEQMGDEHLGILRADVTSAQPLPESYRTRLREKIEQATGKKVLMTFSEKPSLIAGIVTQIGDLVVDGSIRGKLTQLADSLQQP
jgi:F-type H+-transporting ATPase subunit delta